MNSIEKQINNHLSLLQNEEHGILVDDLRFYTINI